MGRESSFRTHLIRQVPDKDTIVSKKKSQQSTHPSGWDYVAFAELCEKLGALSPRRADSLGFHLAELIECCAKFSAKVDDLVKSVRKTRRNSTDLVLAAMNLAGEFDHMKYHIRCAAPSISILDDFARNMPPLKELPDDELSTLMTVSYTHLTLPTN